jgi:hypothetical protein
VVCHQDEPGEESLVKGQTDGEDHVCRCQVAKREGSPSGHRKMWKAGVASTARGGMC